MKRTLSNSFFITAILLSLLAWTPPQPVHAASLVVNTLVDENDGSCLDGDCSLRDAIAVANDTDVITFSVTGTIILTNALTVDKSLTITGPGSSQLILDGDDKYQIFILSDDTPTNTINISGMTMTRGYADPAVVCGGGAIRSWAFLTMDDVVITDNHAPANGGACLYPRGGGILFFNGKGSLTLTNSTVSNNSTYYGGGGIYFNSYTGNISLDNVTVDGNQSTGDDGGGVSVENALATIHISNSIITNNDAGSAAGGLLLFKNSTTPTVSIENSTIAHNTAISSGGGIFVWGLPVDITNSSVSYNTTSNDGGGIYNSNGSVTITSSTLTSNSATSSSFSEGGGIFNLGNNATSSITIVNSTLTNNSSTLGRGGAIFNQASGSTVTDIATISIYNSTIVGNSANNSFGGGGIVASNASSIEISTITLFNSIVYGNTLVSGTNGENCARTNSGTIVVNNRNLFQDLPNDCNPGVNDVTSSLATSAVVNALASNGGVTATMSLPSSSPAFDAGDDAICAAAPVNNQSQNGAARPANLHCDIGSFEKQPTFADVPFNGFAWSQIETIYDAGITGGCGGGNYCPNNTVTRAQMAVFLLRGIHGSSYTPPAATGTVFNDVPSNAFAAAWIEQMVSEGITSGCGGGNYCPNGLVTRAQMAVFLLRAKHGSGYTPPAATGTVFTDVPLGSFAAAWIEQMVSEGITSGCGGGNYCPNQAVTRAQMAVFLVKTFNLP